MLHLLTLPRSVALLLLLHLSCPSPTLAARTKTKPKTWVRFSKVVGREMPSAPTLFPAGNVTGKAILSAPATNTTLHMYLKASGSFPGGANGETIPFAWPATTPTAGLYFRLNAKRPFTFRMYLKGNWGRASTTQVAFKSFTAIPPWLGQTFKVNPSNLALGLLLKPATGKSRFISWGGVTLKESK